MIVKVIPRRFRGSKTYHLSPDDANDLTDSQLREHPFFLDFANPQMHSSSNGCIVADNYSYRAEMLAYAIPAESYAVGANPLSILDSASEGVGRANVSFNHNMADEFVDGREDLSPDEDSEDRQWRHSTFAQRSYKRTKGLFKKIVDYMKGSNDE